MRDGVRVLGVRLLEVRDVRRAVLDVGTRPYMLRNEVLLRETPVARGVTLVRVVVRGVRVARLTGWTV